jgi:hypothetical protein
MDAREVCFQIAREHADGVLDAIEARRRMQAADREVGVSVIVGAYRGANGTLHVIAVRRSERARLDVIEVMDEEPARSLHTVYGQRAAAERRAFQIAEALLTDERRAA